MDPEWEIRKVRWPEPDALSGPLSANGVTYGRIRFLIGAPQEDQTLARNRGRGVENLHGREPRGINFWGPALGGEKNRDTGDGCDVEKSNVANIPKVSRTNHYVTRKYNPSYNTSNIFFHWHFFHEKWHNGEICFTRCHVVYPLRADQSLATVNLNSHPIRFYIRYIDFEIQNQ